MTKAKSLLRGTLLVGGIGLGMLGAQPASAQALGDANCPGGYYFDPGYRVCVPYGYVYAPGYDAYDPGYVNVPPIYGPSFLVFPDRRRQDRDRDRDRGIRHDDDHRR